MKAAQQVAGGAKAVGAAGAQVGHGLKIRCERRNGILDALGGPASGLERPLRAARAARDAGQTAVGEARVLYSFAVDAHAERGRNGGDVLVDALGEFVACDQSPGLTARNRDAGDQLAAAQILLHVAEVEILERHPPLRGAAAQVDLRSQGEHDRNRIADRRSVRKISAKRRGIADRRRGEAGGLFGEFGEPRQQRRPGVAERHRSTDPQFPGRVLDAGQFGHVADIDQGLQLAQLLGHQKPDVQALPPQLMVFLAEQSV